ncbi:hypothetical protein [Alicyclobacillus sp. SO9]|uniref:glycan biosynthesis hexose transferase WsfD n=1 Tax=Alicyclobacillus sp. SO9 TaxID=2665646 RepID=UPI0018E8D19E|nr:hypothetical protein [Alicyclobacillus sp. SO9]QQE80636.1 hypothetical protein GI364_09680 [Alicyclobacillus sp. SO9]
MAKRSLLRHPELITAVVGFVLIYCTIMLPHMIGLADQGDFIRSMQVFGIRHMSHNRQLEYLNYANRFFRSGFPHESIAYFSSVYPLILAALVINHFLHPGLFDIEILGVIYILFVSLSFFLLIRAVKMLTPHLWVAYVAGALCLFIFADIGYTTYFNSFFEEPAAYVSFLLMIGFAMNIVVSSKRSLFYLVAFGISAASFITAKQEDLPLVLPIAILCVGLAFVQKGSTWKTLSMGLSVVLILIAFADFKITNPVYNKINVFESVFRGVLYHQPQATVVKDLKWFGVDQKYKSLADMSWWDKNKPYNVEGSEFQKNFFAKVNHVSVVEFYLTHPGRLYEAMQSSTDAAVTNRPMYLGNFQKSSGYPPVTIAHRMSGWSTLKRKLLPRSIWALVIFYVLYFGLLIYRFLFANSKNRAIVGIFIIIGLMSILEFPVPYTAEGITELVKHLFVFDVITDFMLGLSVVWLLYKIFAKNVRSR